MLFACFVLFVCHIQISQIVHPRPSKKTIKKNKFLHKPSKALAINDGVINNIINNESNDPLSYKEAIMESPNAKEWQVAIDVEFKSLAKNSTWSLLQLPSN